MVDKIQDQLADKLKKSQLPIEFNRQKEAYKHLENLKITEDNKC